MPSNNIEDYVHRIGRAGRKTKDGYNKGASFSFFTNKNSRMADELVQLLNDAGSVVPPELERMGGGGGGYGGGGGRGYGGGGGGGGRGGGSSGGRSGDNSAPLGPRRY